MYPGIFFSFLLGWLCFKGKRAEVTYFACDVFVTDQSESVVFFFFSDFNLTVLIALIIIDFYLDIN